MTAAETELIEEVELVVTWRADQLELFGLTAAGIARRITALQHEESLEAR